MVSIKCEIMTHDIRDGKGVLTEKIVEIPVKSKYISLQDINSTLEDKLDYHPKYATDGWFRLENSVAQANNVSLNDFFLMTEKATAGIHSDESSGTHFSWNNVFGLYGYKDVRAGNAVTCIICCTAFELLYWVYWISCTKSVKNDRNKLDLSSHKIHHHSSRVCITLYQS